MFKFKKATRRNAAPKIAAAPEAAQKESEVVGLIQGIMAGSKEEWRVAKALWKHKIRFGYQVSYRGGRTRGGLVVDFVLYWPITRALRVQGANWHSENATRDRVQKAILTSIFGVPPIDIWDYEIPTQDDADKIVLQRVRVG